MQLFIRVIVIAQQLFANIGSEGFVRRVTRVSSCMSTISDGCRSAGGMRSTDIALLARIACTRIRRRERWNVLIIREVSVN